MKNVKQLGRDEGLIFNIQRFSIHDGPGIRTTVFMKGCPLTCRWCANPEAQDFFPNLITRDINCRGCGRCVAFCPAGAITMTKKGGRILDWAKCNQCLQCVSACLFQALNISGRVVKLEEVVKEVLSDAAFYENSGGGVTVSGGEPLSQSKFVAALLSTCREKGLHTALDTAGFAPWRVMEEVLRFTDLVLFDVKHLDPVEHKRATGVDNVLILDNLIKAARLTKIWLRVPLMAGFNDSEEHIEALTVLGKKSHAEKISLLPYHEGGKVKCQQMGRSYGFPKAVPPGDEHLQKLKEIILKAGINVAIGN